MSCKTVVGSENQLSVPSQPRMTLLEFFCSSLFSCVGVSSSQGWIACSCHNQAAHMHPTLTSSPNYRRGARGIVADLYKQQAARDGPPVVDIMPLYPKTSRTRDMVNSRLRPSCRLLSVLPRILVVPMHSATHFLLLFLSHPPSPYLCLPPPEDKIS